jgi:uncharacterized protein
VPFARRRAREHGKNLKISVTTNCTLVSDDIIEFFRDWNVGFHASIDGTPQVQNANRSYADGSESAANVERAVERILKVNPGTTARATVISQNVCFMYESYLYFRKLGFSNIAMVPGEPQEWNKETLLEYEGQLQMIAEHWKQEIMRGVNVGTFFFPVGFNGKNDTPRRSFSCGAGRHMVSIDIFGNIWPCNRWSVCGQNKWEQWRLGNIYQEFSEKNRTYFLDGNVPFSKCDTCIGKVFCNGGCHTVNINTTGDIRSQHDNACQLSRIHARIALDLYDDLYTAKDPTFMLCYYPEEWKRMNEQTITHSELEQKNESCEY